MKNIFLIAALCLFSVPAAAQDPAPAAAAPAPKAITQYVYGPLFLCANFNTFLKQDGDSYHLTGEYNVPSPGYTYAFSPISVQEGHAYAVLTIAPPQEAVKKLLTPPMALDYTFETKEPFRELRIDVQKSFNWGDERIICTKASR
jgi:hypothetical protein